MTKLIYRQIVSWRLNSDLDILNSGITGGGYSGIYATGK